MNRQFQPIPYSPEIKLYFEAAGFEVPETEPLPNGMLFVKGNLAVQFWGDKIQVSINNGIHWNTSKIYQGFDRTNMNHLMMIMHVMEVIDLAKVREAANEEYQTQKHLRDLKRAKDYNFNSESNLATSNY
jgi:hypothetical protein